MIRNMKGEKIAAEELKPGMQVVGKNGKKFRVLPDGGLRRIRLRRRKGTVKLPSGALYERREDGSLRRIRGETLPDRGGDPGERVPSTGSGTGKAGKGASTGSATR